MHARIKRGRGWLVRTLDSAAATYVVDALEQCARNAADRWRTLFDHEDEETTTVAPEQWRPRRPGIGVRLFPDDEDEDDEVSDCGSASATMQTQRMIVAVVDARIGAYAHGRLG